MLEDVRLVHLITSKFALVKATFFYSFKENDFFFFFGGGVIRKEEKPS